MESLVDSKYEDKVISLTSSKLHVETHSIMA